MSSDIVSTNSGKVKGKLVKLDDGKSVHVYRNIPYAKPPTGSLRFMPPVPADPWDGVRDAIVAGNKPWYMETFEEMMSAMFPMDDPDIKPVCDEDCLHVSVYTPYPQKGKKLPVMVWLYGGGFQMGSETTYNGGVLSGMNDVVVVVPNYRVGVFGFFSLGPDSSCPGNAGLLDQQQALRWVQDNVEYFGGDKNNVTIFGESAGGASVHLNVISPLARGLFHKAISHSGQAAMITMASNDSQRKRSHEILAKQLKLDASGGPELLEALLKIPAKEIMDAVTAVIEQDVGFFPCVDGHVLPKDVDEMIDQRKFAKVPYIIGCNNTEGSGLLAQFSGKDYIGGFTEAEARKGMFLTLTDEGYEKCKKEYLRDEDGERKFSMLLSNVLGNGVFVAPAVQSAIKHAEGGGDVYFYLGAFQLKMHHDAEYSGKVTRKASWCQCDHGDDVLMTFGLPFSSKLISKGAKFSEEERNLSKNFMTYLTNFARTGDPNKGKQVPTKWPKYQPRGEHLVVAHPFSTDKNLGEKEVKFWMKDMKPYIKKE